VSPQTCPSQKCLTALKKWSIGGGGGRGGAPRTAGSRAGTPDLGCTHVHNPENEVSHLAHLDVTENAISAQIRQIWANGVKLPI